MLLSVIQYLAWSAVVTYSGESIWTMFTNSPW